ncbi:YceI family protein [Mucilaginibacter mali]|uniref:YceI family protein n=1 Tax=Mucilaginibacter mali TaxID=2740462 RepID=A0A7D4PWK8_9SPHI|nr:YceI family protein [Mucilaginibacter mali]QKJ31863.1 YceI family protein [Mucilaginibacter mali]
MKKFILLAIAAAFANLAPAQTKHKVTASTITFKIKNMGINTGGNISGLVADINFSKDRPEASSIEASVDAGTLNTDNDMRDKHIKSEDYFDAAKYPKITMKSTSIKHRSGNNFVGTFNVTIKDKTKSIDVPFTYVVNGNTAEFKGSLKIQRTDFGIGSSGLVLANEATIDIDVQTTPS